MKDNPVVLLVDDNDDNLQLIATALNPLNCNLAYSDNPHDVLDQIKSISPDLILMDIVMPDMDGYSLCCEIKSSETFKDIPIIFITALNEQRSLARAFESGGIDYITKPLDSNELKARVGSHLKIKEGNEKLRSELGNSSTTIDVLIKKFNRDFGNLKKMITSNIETLVTPYLQSLQSCALNKRQKKIVEIIIGNLASVTSTLYGPASPLSHLTATELKIANLIRLGKVNKEISDLLRISPATVAFHRKNIREKLGLLNKNINLFSYLSSLENQKSTTLFIGDSIHD